MAKLKASTRAILRIRKKGSLGRGGADFGAKGARKMEAKYLRNPQVRSGLRSLYKNKSYSSKF